MFTQISKRLRPAWAVAATCLSLVAWPVYASDNDFSDGITVDSTADAIDANVGDNICADAGGNCTLRAAIQEANATVGANTINLPAGVYTLTIDGVDEDWSGTGTEADPYVVDVTANAAIGDLDITDTLTINGAGADSTVIEWDQGTAQDNDPAVGDRIFHIQATTTTIDEVAINNLTVRGGSVGVVPNTDCAVLDNPYDIEIMDGDTCSIWQFRRVGGAIAMGPGAAVVLYESAVHGPDAGGGGGGEDMGPFPGGKPGDEEDGATITAVTLDGVVMAGNESGADGGALFNAAPTLLANSVISGNFSGANGGGIYNDEALEIANTTVGAFFDTVPAQFDSGTDLSAGNQAENGGGMFDTGFHTTVIRQSAVNGNSAIGGGGIAGRALIVIDITNSTISDNVATDVGGGITTNGTVNLTNVTVANNSASSDAPGGGGGLNSFGDGTYNMYNSIIAANTKTGAEATVTSNCGCSGGAVECPAGRMVSLGYNLEDDTTCQLSFTGDLSSTDPLFVAGGLADNNADLAGLTETLALQADDPGTGAVEPTSAAVDSGDATNCPNNDQRGSLRPADGDLDGVYTCDRGAYEVFIATADVHINNMNALDRVDKGDNFTVSVEIHSDATATAEGVELDVVLPAGLDYVSASTASGTCAEAAGTVTCTMNPLPMDAVATVNVVANAVDATNVGDTPYNITAEVSSTSPADTNLTNNSAAVNVTVVGANDLQLSASADRSSLVVNREVTVTFTVTNAGPDDATGVRLGGTLPDGTTLVSATPDNGSTCAQVADEVVCELGDILAASPTVSVVAVLQPTTLGTKEVSASVTADQTDTDASNDTASATVTVVRETGDGGGFCSYHPNGRFDPVLPLLVVMGLLYLGWRRRLTVN